MATPEDPPGYVIDDILLAKGIGSLDKFQRQLLIRTVVKGRPVEDTPELSQEGYYSELAATKKNLLTVILGLEPFGIAIQQKCIDLRVGNNICAYHNGFLSEDEKKRIIPHIAICAECQERKKVLDWVCKTILETPEKFFSQKELTANESLDKYYGLEVTGVKVSLHKGSAQNTGDRLLAYVKFTLNHCFVVNKAKIILGNSGPFVSMPSEKRRGVTPYFDFAHPINQTTRRMIEAHVFAEYERVSGVPLELTDPPRPVTGRV